MLFYAFVAVFTLCGVYLFWANCIGDGLFSASLITSLGFIGWDPRRKSHSDDLSNRSSRRQSLNRGVRVKVGIHFTCRLMTATAACEAQCQSDSDVIWTQ